MKEKEESEEWEEEKGKGGRNSQKQKRWRERGRRKSKKTRGYPCPENKIKKTRGPDGNQRGAVTHAVRCAGGGPSSCILPAMREPRPSLPDMSNGGAHRPSLNDVTLFWTALIGLYKPLSTRLSL